MAAIIIVLNFLLGLDCRFCPSIASICAAPKQTGTLFKTNEAWWSKGWPLQPYISPGIAQRTRDSSEREARTRRPKGIIFRFQLPKSISLHHRHGRPGRVYVSNYYY